nr:MAG TPA: hypothetical protein [Caudoviricetes sp.]
MNLLFLMGFLPLPQYTAQNGALQCKSLPA